jgi:molecular chaperone GrpE
MTDFTTPGGPGGATSSPHGARAGDPSEDAVNGAVNVNERAGERPDERANDSVNGVTADSLGEVVSDDLLRLATERDEYLDSLRRLQADFENYRKRVQRDMTDAADRSAERLIQRLLPVLDTFELALQHEADADGSALAKVHDSLLSALESEGLERLDPAGEAFDPNDAEAVVHEGEAPAGATGPVVTAVLRAGYRWRGKVIRAAMVKVAG